MFRYFTGVLLIAAVVSCGKKKLDTPEAALEAVQNAYLKRDAKAFTAVLSKETLNDLEEKVDEMRKMFQNMPENDNAKQAFEHMAKQMGMPVSKLKELTVEDFIGYMMNNEGASGSETTLLPKEMLPPAKVMKRVAHDLGIAEGKFQLPERRIRAAGVGAGGEAPAGTYFLIDRRGVVVAEITKSETERTIALSPGTYTVKRRLTDRQRPPLMLPRRRVLALLLERRAELRQHHDQRAVLRPHHRLAQLQRPGRLRLRPRVVPLADRHRTCLEGQVSRRQRIGAAHHLGARHLAPQLPRLEARQRARHPDQHRDRKSVV